MTLTIAVTYPQNESVPVCQDQGAILLHRSLFSSILL